MTPKMLQNPLQLLGHGISRCDQKGHHFETLTNDEEPFRDWPHLNLNPENLGKQRLFFPVRMRWLSARAEGW